MDCIEHLQIGIQTTDGPNLLVSCIYSSPSANNDACVGELSEILNRQNVHNTKFDWILHMGDFNFWEINWHSQNTSVGSDHMATKFVYTVMDSFLIQNVKHPTRFRGENNPRTLDLILTNEEGMIDNIEHCAPIGNSDQPFMQKCKWCK